MVVISKRKSDVKFLTRRLYPLNDLFFYFFHLLEENEDNNAFKKPIL